MINQRWKKILSKEIIYIFLCLFICIAIAEINTGYVVIRSIPDILFYSFFSLWLYIMILSFRAINWGISNYFERVLPKYFVKVESDRGLRYLSLHQSNPFSKLSETKLSKNE